MYACWSGIQRAREPELWSGLISGRGLGVRGSPVRASSVEKLAFLQKARRKGGFFQGQRGETRQLVVRFAVDERRNGGRGGVGQTE